MSFQIVWHLWTYCMTGVYLAAKVAFGSVPEKTIGCGGGLECQIADIVDPIVLSVGITIVLFVAISLNYLQEAKTTLNKEIGQTEAERDAFLAFANRIRDYEFGSVVTEPGRLKLVNSSSPGGTRSEVVDLYRETVMSVPHYEAEYGETARENMHAELGEDVTSVVYGNQSITPTVQRLLRAKAENAGRIRGRFLRVLNDEDDQLETATKQLSSIVKEMEDINPKRGDDIAFDECLNRLQELETECEAIIQTRQDRIHSAPQNRRLRRLGDMPSLQEYVYDQLDVSHPILATTTEILGQIRSQEGNLAKAM